MTNASTPADQAAVLPLYVEEDFFGYHVATYDDRADRGVDSDAVRSLDDGRWINAADQLFIRAGTDLILEATNRIEIRASRVDFVHLPGVAAVADTQGGAVGDRPA
jgi:hypothetical protein